MSRPFKTTIFAAVLLERFLSKLAEPSVRRRSVGGRKQRRRLYAPNCQQRSAIEFFNKITRDQSLHSLRISSPSTDDFLQRL